MNSCTEAMSDFLVHSSGLVDHLMDDIPVMLKTFDFDDDPSLSFSPAYTPSAGVSLRAIDLTGPEDYVILGTFLYSLPFLMS